MKYDILEILPQKPPMVLLDEVTGYDENKRSCTCNFVASLDKIFFDKTTNGINSLVGLEIMAQTIACFSYFKNGCKRADAGLLLGTRLFNNSIEKFEKDKTYKTCAKEVYLDGAIAAFDCAIYDENDNEIQSACINVYQDDNIKEMF